MELKEILAITGKSGLYKFVAKSKHGFVVEPLEGGTRFAVSLMSKVSSLADIAMFMHGKDMPLADVFTTMLPHEEEIRALDLKTNTAEARALYAKILPNYHEVKVHDKDIMKAFKWFLTLVNFGVRDFVNTPQTETEAAAEPKE